MDIQHMKKLLRQAIHQGLTGRSRRSSYKLFNQAIENELAEMRKDLKIIAEIEVTPDYILFDEHRYWLVEVVGDHFESVDKHGFATAEEARYQSVLVIQHMIMRKFILAYKGQYELTSCQNCIVFRDLIKLHDLLNKDRNNILLENLNP